MTALVERIYWHEDSSSVYSASEAKALLRILPQLREFDKIGVAQFLTFGCTLESRTLFRNVNESRRVDISKLRLANRYKKMERSDLECTVLKVALQKPTSAF